jgi:hypothetical protein
MRVGPRLGAMLLVAPLLLFLLGSFLAPIGAFLWRAVAEDEVAAVLPRTVAALSDWDGRDLPGDAAFAALAEDLREARARDAETGAGGIARAAARLNADMPGFRSLLPATGRRVAGAEADPRAAVLAASPEWARVETWGAIRRAAGPLTDFHLLAALDLKRDAAGGIGPVAGDQAVFRGILLRTLWMSLLVMAACLALGYPARLADRHGAAARRAMAARRRPAALLDLAHRAHRRLDRAAAAGGGGERALARRGAGGRAALPAVQPLRRRAGDGAHPAALHGAAPSTPRSARWTRGCRGRRCRSARRPGVPSCA